MDWNPILMEGEVDWNPILMGGAVNWNPILMGGAGEWGFHAPCIKFSLQLLAIVFKTKHLYKYFQLIKVAAGGSVVSR